MSQPPHEPASVHQDTASCEHALALLALSNAMSAPKRKRGRPRKCVDPSVAIAYAHDDTCQYQDALALLAFSNATPKRKRGRPRKYVDPSVALTMSAPKRKPGRPRKLVDQTVVLPLAIVPAPDPTSDVPTGFSLGLRGWPPVMPSPLPPPPPPSANATQCINKSKVGEPSSTVTKKQHEVTVAGPGVMGINPEVVIIQVGEDVATEIMSLSGSGWAVCIISAHGALSMVTLRQGASFPETVTYEGYFEMLSLCGSYQASETDGMSTITGGLGITLAGPGGRPFGGGVAGPLTAASPVQVVIGRFPVDENKELSASISAHGSNLTESSGRPGGAAN